VLYEWEGHDGTVANIFNVMGMIILIQEELLHPRKMTVFE
jgi:hypothetical protein